MSVAQATVASFADEARLLLHIAANLGEHRRHGRRDDFTRSVMALGMEAQEADRYWEAIAPRSEAEAVNSHAPEIDWKKIKSNTDLADRLGIALHGQAQPRNTLLYHLMQLHFPDFFRYEVTRTVRKLGSRGQKSEVWQWLVHFPQPLAGPAANGELDDLSVFRALSGVEPSQFSARVLKAATSCTAVLGKDLGLKLAELMIGCKMEIPRVKMVQQLARVLDYGRQGVLVTVVGAFCPDYYYEENTHEGTVDPHIPYRYTFDGLGDGIGLVAKQFVRIVPAMSECLSEIGIQHRIVLGIGDFEADSEEVLRQVGLSRQEFLDRCQRSLNTFAAAVPHHLPLELEMFGGQRSKGRLRPYAQDAVAEMLAGRFGRMAEVHDDLHAVLARIPAQYRTFYERWYGRKMDDLAVNQIVLQQGSEYAAVARIYADDFGDNILMLAGDRPEMHRFNAFYSVFPTLCAKRAY